jgi:hypothetical protein
MDNSIDPITTNSISIPDYSQIITALTEPPARKKVDPEIVKILWSKGYNSAQIGKALKISRNTVFYHLNNLSDKKDLVRNFVDHRVEVLQSVQRDLLTSIDSDEIKKTPIGSRVLAFAQLYDKERLEQGLSTSNQSVNVGLHRQLSPAISRARYSSTPVNPTPVLGDNGSGNPTKDTSD